MLAKITAYLLSKCDLLLIIGFVLFISVPLVVGVYREDVLSSGLERRNLSQLPPLPTTLQEVQSFPTRIDSYYSDQFGFRNALTRIRFAILALLASDSAGKNVTAGKDGWLFLGSIKPDYAGYADPIGDVMNINRYTEAQLATFAVHITAIRDWLAQQGIHYVYVITPNKHTVYTDKLPDFIKKVHPQSATDQLFEYLQEHTDIVAVDLRAALAEERQAHEVYLKLDSHWNSFGANVGQYEVMKAVERLYPDKVRPFKLPPDAFSMGESRYGDLATSAGMTGAVEPAPEPVFSATCTPYRESESPDFFAPFTMICEDRELDVLIFRDSFFTAMQPYTSRQFHRSTYIWNTINYLELRDYIEREMPDLVIDQRVERALPYVPDGRLFLDALQEATR